ncbi:MAG: hypothetical protein AB199_03530 [Parcubacteria bacterium C7867-004]|nr:MAG: hypothetical protein AB199_03530 [Parcubacteria bacterium C7867-004]
MTYNQRSNVRPLPSSMPEFILVNIARSAFKGQLQWKATYRLYDNGRASDDIDVVVNFNSYVWPQSDHDVWWWVKPVSMAPQQRLVFAEAVQRLDTHDAPLTVRTHDQLVLDFVWSEDEKRYVAHLDGWKVVFSSDHVARAESWRVEVTDIRLATGIILTRPIGPSPKAVYRPPANVGYLSLTPLYEPGGTIETDALTYSSWCNDRQGASLTVHVEHEGKILRLECTQLRLRGKQLLGFVSHPGRYPYLAELVLLEGQPVGLPEAPYCPPATPPRFRSRMSFREQSFYEADAEEDYRDYLAEIRENEEWPVYDWD